MVQAIDILCIICGSATMLIAIHLFYLQMQLRFVYNYFRISQLSYVVCNLLFSASNLLIFILIEFLDIITVQLKPILYIPKDLFFMAGLSFCFSATLIKYQRLNFSKSKITKIFYIISWLSSTISFTISTIARFEPGYFFIDGVVYALTTFFHIFSEFWFLYKIINIILEQKESSYKKRLLYLYYGGLLVSAFASVITYLLSILIAGVDKKVIYIAVVAVPIHAFCSINLLLLAVFVKKEKKSSVGNDYQTTSDEVIGDLDSYVELRSKKKKKESAEDSN